MKEDCGAMSGMNDWQGKANYTERTCPSAALPTTDPTWLDPGSNSGSRGLTTLTTALPTRPCYCASMSHILLCTLLSQSRLVASLCTDVIVYRSMSPVLCWSVTSSSSFGATALSEPWPPWQPVSPRPVVRFLNKILSTGWGCQPHAQPPTWRARVSLLVWTLPFDLSGMCDPTSS
jgi:hypothetical protein